MYTPAYNDRMSSSFIQPNWDVVIAGGGPAGFFAAIRCAELSPRLRVLDPRKGAANSRKSADLRRRTVQRHARLF